ncbi:hypothetical protein E4U09_005808 [Claviceps aff. purpurea]|uniref:Uncharacterized protein n=1 Tax=Claviceps aff. purpurea TaxID=1967640 RepID=A0A9P7U5K1_9HYPO|nr:hypothetical protein E4U09_005808 [Claviceps aff. purpurea]
MHGFLSFLSLYKKLCSAAGHSIKNEIRDIRPRTTHEGQRTRTISTTEANRAVRTTLLPRRSLWIFGRFEEICIWISRRKNPHRGPLRYIYTYTHTQLQAWQANRYPYLFLLSPSQASTLSHFIDANPGIAEAPGSQYNGGVWCGSPKLVTTRLPSGEVVSVWGVPPKPGEETLPMLPPAKKPKDKKKKK